MKAKYFRKNRVTKSKKSRMKAVRKDRFINAKWQENIKNKLGSNNDFAGETADYGYTEAAAYVPVSVAPSTPSAASAPVAPSVPGTQPVVIKEPRKPLPKPVKIGIGVATAAAVAGLAAFAFYSTNGWKDGGTRYLTFGEPAVGITEIDGITYVFNDEGIYVPGWTMYAGTKYYQDGLHGIYTGDCEIEGHNYHLNPDGTLYAGAVTIDGTFYLYDEYGYPITGFYSYEGNTYYAKENGTLVHGYKTIDEKKYHFDEETGIMSQGLTELDNAIYYFDEEGVMTFGFVTLEDGTRFFSKSGKMYTGPLKQGSDNYLINEDGLLYTGFWTDEEGREYYYAEPDGKMFHGWMKLGEEYCYYNEAGYKVKGWNTIEDKLYYFTDADGYLMHGWQEIDGASYYFVAEGYAATGVINIEGKYYYFNVDGKQLRGEGWHNTYGKKYLNADNSLTIGFADINGVTYYFDGTGSAVSGLRTIGGQNYYFYESGELARNTQIGNYVVDANGVATNAFAVITATNLDAYIQVLLDNTGRDLFSIYNYCKTHFSYKYRDKSDITSMACRMLNYGSGACWDYAALCYKMMTAAGYNVRIVIGRGAVYSEHNWLLVEVSPGVWRHYDPERQGLPIYNLTDAQLAAYDGYTRTVRYQWDRGAYPAAN